LVEALIHLNKEMPEVSELGKLEDGRVQAIYISQLGEEVGELLVNRTGDPVSGNRTDREGVCGEDERSMSIDGIS
jgi:hypothetical protein